MKKWCDGPNPPLTDFFGELDKLWESINAPAFQKLVTERLDFQGLDETLTPRQMCMALINQGYMDTTLKVEKLEGGTYDMISLTSNEVCRTYDDRIKMNTKDIDSVHAELQSLSLSNMRGDFAKEELTQLVGNYNMGSATASKGYKLQEEIRNKMLSELENHPDSSTQPKTMKDISANPYIKMTNLVTNMDITALGTVKESLGTFTVLFHIKQKSKPEIDLLRKVANFLKFTTRSSVPGNYRTQKLHLQDQIKTLTPNTHWTRVDFRLGRGKEVDWAVMCKPSGPGGRWELYAKGSVTPEGTDYRENIATIVGQFRTKLGK